MRVDQLQTPYQGISPENVYYAYDDMDHQIGVGYIIYQYQEHMYPDCPINLYFAIECEPSARYLLFGALVARARQLRESNPTVHARFYTAISPEDTASREFYRHSGLHCDDTENALRLNFQQGMTRLPMGCSISPASMNTEEDIQSFLKRLHDNDMTYISRNYLGSLMLQPHFRAVGLLSGNTLVGEALMSGVGDSATLEGIYIVPGFRRQGLGKALLGQCMAGMRNEGVTNFHARMVTRSLPQQGLARAFAATDLGANMVFPCLYL